MNLAAYYKITPESVIFAMLRAAGASLPEAYFFSHSPFKKLDGNETQELYKAAANLRDSNPGIKSMIKTFSESREKKYLLLQQAKEDNKLFDNEEETFSDEELKQDAQRFKAFTLESTNQTNTNKQKTAHNQQNNANNEGEEPDTQDELLNDINNNKYNNKVEVLKTRAGLIDSMINAVKTTRGKERVQALQTLAKLQEKDFEDEEEEEKRVKIYLPFDSDCRQCKLFQDARAKV